METIELDGAVLSFSKLTTGQEKEFSEDTRRIIMADARRDADEMELQGSDRAEYLAAMSSKCAGGKCGMLTQLGAEYAFTPAGMMRLLKTASAKHHPAPGIDEATLLRLLLEKTEDVHRVVIAVYPGDVQKKIAAKKAAGQTAIRPGTS